MSWEVQNVGTTSEEDSPWETTSELGSPEVSASDSDGSSEGPSFETDSSWESWNPSVHLWPKEKPAGVTVHFAPHQHFLSRPKAARAMVKKPSTPRKGKKRSAFQSRDRKTGQFSCHYIKDRTTTIRRPVAEKKAKRSKRDEDSDEDRASPSRGRFHSPLHRRHVKKGNASKRTGTP